MARLNPRRTTHSRTIELLESRTLLAAGPADISLSPSVILEHTTNTLIFNTTDRYGGVLFLYALVEGPGATDNAAFDLSGAFLSPKKTFDFEQKSSYSIRVRSTNAEYASSVEEAFTITVTDGNDPPAYVGWTPMLYATAGDQPVSLHSVDVDDDSDIDLISANAGDNTLSILKNRGDATFETKVDYGAGLGVHRVTSADLNADAKPDLITVNGTTFSVLLNNGDGTFASKSDYDTGDQPSGACAGDFDKDGDQDIAVSLRGGQFRIYRNAGDGTFVAGPSYTTGANPSDIAAADFDKDGDLDLVTANTDSKSLSVFSNHSFSFASRLDLTVQQQPSQIALADRDGNGTMDVIASTSTGFSVFLKMTGINGGFDGERAYTVARPAAIRAADVDGDGRTDIVTVSRDYDGVWVLPSGLNYPYRLASLPSPAGLALADLNGDASVDIGAANETLDRTTIITDMRPALLTENLPSGTVIGDLVTTDPNTGDAFAYSLYGGAGGNDNALFQIVGGELRTSDALDYETKSRLSVDVQVTDSGGLKTYRHFIIDVRNASDKTPTIKISDDTGDSGSDFLTNDQTLTLWGKADAGSTVHLYRNEVLIGSTTADNSYLGNWLFDYSSVVLADGTHTFEARSEIAGDPNIVVSAPRPVTIDTIGPAAPPTPDLSAADDTGMSDSDNITSDFWPCFTVASPPPRTSLYVQRFANNLYSGTANAYLFTGLNLVEAGTSDEAGNVTYSAPLHVYRDDTAPFRPSAPVIQGANGTGAVTVSAPTLNLSPGQPYQPLWAIRAALHTTPYSIELVEFDAITGAFLRSSPLLNQFYYWEAANNLASSSTTLYHVVKPTSSSGSIDMYDIQTLAHTGPLALTGTSVYTSAAYLDGSLYVTTLAGEIVPINPATGMRSAPVTLTDGGGPASIRKITGAADRHRLIGIDAAGRVVEIDPLTPSLTVIPIPSLAAPPQSIAYANNQLYYSPTTYSNQYHVVDLVSGTDTAPTFSQYSAVISFGGDGALITPPVEYYRVYRDGALVSDPYLSSSTFTDASLPDGTYVYTVTAVDAEGNESSASDPVTVTIDTASPAISSLKLGDGSVQRSMVTTVTVILSEPIDFQAGALTVQTRRGGALTDISVDVANPLEDDKTFILTFRGIATSGGSLPDGLYRVFASAAGIHDLAGNPLTGDYSYQFHRLFGDSDGDRDVDRLDLTCFRRALNRPAQYNEIFDYNGDMKIDLTDYMELKKRLTRTRLL